MSPFTLNMRLVHAAVITLLSGCVHAQAGIPVAFPESQPGIGFDDLAYSAGLRKVLIPAGRSGTLNLIDPATRAVTAIHGFESKPNYEKGHDDGPTSADEGHGLVFVADRTSQKLAVVDPSTQSIIASVPLAAGPDYVRYVAANNEVWVTQPEKERIEVFALPESGPQIPSHKMFITISGGPESLVLDPVRGRAYTHLWKGQTVSIDVKEHALTAQWPNGCQGSRGIAVDAPRGWVFAACAEGKAVVLDVEHGGAQLSVGQSGGRVDVVGYSEKLGHLYLATSTGRLAVLGVSPKGKLKLLGSLPTTGGRCVTADDQGNAWVCDPKNGQILSIKDPFQ